MAQEVRFVVADTTDAESWASLVSACGSPRLHEHPRRQPRSTLVLCRDVLQHMSFAEAQRALANFAGRHEPRLPGQVLLLVSSYPSTLENVDFPVETEHPLFTTHGLRTRRPEQPPPNLRLRPFNLPKPLLVLAEETSGKTMLLYRAEDLQ
eukprot:gnl/TRDRNA2_/TRDRNA2_140133_c1_seq1.p1 gnl/TRDRNA2_/TRDRNA2_140133_c1~~gnl/TRDRNA2_/TRDRNA2_140133_c1_seq1.p1  ORF type:complete len:170 (-),score=23.97 gnl/TRDRNA2_/TRDRNA2_140133_c1_seq1:47-499(-)